MATYEAKQGTLTAVTAGKTSSVGGYSASASDAYLYEGTTAATFKLYRKVNHFGDTGYYNLVSPVHGDRVIGTPTSGSKFIYTFSVPAPAWRVGNTADAQGVRVRYVAVEKTASEVATEYNNNTNCIMKSSASKPTTYDQYIFDTTNKVLYRYAALVKDTDGTGTPTTEYIQIWEKFTPAIGTLIAVGSGTSATTYIYSRAAGSWA